MPNMTNEYTLGTYNSRDKVVAELDARDVAYANNDPFRPKNGHVSLIERLKALPDVVTGNDGKFYLKRIGPSWDDPVADDDDELDLVENAVAGRAAPS